ncbi:hypothetical protein CMV_011343 [Castanea mollissima]|uniref:Transmembrane protein n=1 Tax=Castanea mollissima TaxID=60419 RepID=A0A8J4VX02_9ROSI|nr:hypothetical protein CMV_011343 [Castanea mollissima]
MPNPDFYEVSKMNGLIIYTHGFGIFLPGLFGTVDPYLCKNLNMTARREQLGASRTRPTYANRKSKWKRICFPNTTK